MARFEFELIELFSYRLYLPLHNFSRFAYVEVRKSWSEVHYFIVIFNPTIAVEGPVIEETNLGVIINVLAINLYCVQFPVV